LFHFTNFLNETKIDEEENVENLKIPSTEELVKVSPKNPQNNDK